jgi:ubiquinone biosynthesis protein UbiJ
VSDDLDWERALEAWTAEDIDAEGTWVTLAEAERRAEVALLRQRVDELEARLRRLEGGV